MHFLAKRLKLVWLILFFGLSCLQDGLCAAVSIKELVSTPEVYDGETVELVGEVIGDIMPRAEYAWINIKDSSGYLIGVWLLKNLLKDISFKGSYNFKGDVVKVEGVFYRKCSIHQGDLDVHASTLSIVTKGYALGYPVQMNKIKSIAALGVISLCLSVLIGLKKKREA